MVREILAPGLRDLGFKGSGAQYLLPSDDHWAGLGIQRWYTGDSTKVHFTINLSVVKKSAWNEIRDAGRTWKLPPGRRPSANAKYSTLQWQDRLGALMPGTQGDTWWDLGRDDDPATVAADVLAAIRDYGLPELRSRTGTGS
jgi:uncharacterized protein DUF4304